MSVAMSLPVHVPVLLDEVITALQPRPGSRFIDCTVGLGGHAAAILEEISPSGRLLGIDADPEAIKASQDRLRDRGKAVILVNDNFVNLEAICERYHFHPVDGILFDLGVSSLQLDTAERGFSFHLDAPLDMRFDPGQGLTASDIVNRFSEQELAKLIERYGEERHSRRIARHIVQNRPVATTVELARLVERVLGGKRARIHPATRTFMALRIAVNSELQNLELALRQTPNLLRPGGRLTVISYHSLEDRIVKQFMRYAAASCLCPPGTVMCRCGHVPTLKLISRKVIKPTSLEIESNPRSRSARLRIAERLN
ncbi:MAG: 16S rRNA (cytosine(1402)-N(4))-methyltransferase RsmH [Dehalococcoidia bacterium]|nr:16S rRNA (cytosine(1402)-N(4))-methyltransferase RsmH [Dehalococcoidia bacterium]MDH4368041.1 16S rRNA (cytosine(1402)-N(4))-methyltransferase RsmH [Dehalococcoidia bacterium]